MDLLDLDFLILCCWRYVFVVNVPYSTFSQRNKELNQFFVIMHIDIRSLASTIVHLENVQNEIL